MISFSAYPATGMDVTKILLFNTIYDIINRVIHSLTELDAFNGTYFNRLLVRGSNLLEVAC
jgi:hypothetical protein